MRAQVRYATVGLALWALGCGPAKPPDTPKARYVAEALLVPTGELSSPSFVVQQRLKGQYGTRDTTLDCVVQLAHGKLTVVGLTPFGTRAFMVEQSGTEVRFEKFVERDVPFDPADVLADIHRVFFRSLTSSPGAVPSDGTYEGVDRGELVRETWKGGNLVERRFQSLEGPVSNLVTVTFEGPKAPIVAPHVRLTNVAYGYTLEIENLEQKTLEEGYTLEVERDAAPE